MEASCIEPFQPINVPLRENVKKTNDSDRYAGIVGIRLVHFLGEVRPHFRRKIRPTAFSKKVGYYNIRPRNICLSGSKTPFVPEIIFSQNVKNTIRPQN